MGLLSALRTAHGVHLARDPEGVKRFVQAARYPIHKQAVDAWVWGLSTQEYLQKADVWPLNPSTRGDGQTLVAF